ncbi:MAG: DUF1565 domain-containing protein [Cyanobacteriota bacterium]|nr:DUF1565 domain-containing protein [Cyanobacteriota bacterium]
MLKLIYVNPTIGSDGNSGSQQAPLKTITQALKQSASGTKIQLVKDNYNASSGEIFPLVVPFGVTIIGNEQDKGNGIVINGSGKHFSRIFASQNVTFVLNSGVQLRGLTVTNSASRGTAVWIESSSPTVANCTFINSQREGVLITGNANPVIKDNIFTQNSANGISISRNSRGEIRGNSCFQTGFGISIGDSATSKIIDNKIYDNHSGVVVSGDARPFLRENVCENNTQDGLTVVANALPDIGNNKSPGNNIFRDNSQFDIQNASINKLISIDNQVELQSVNGKIQFFADPEPEPELETQSEPEPELETEPQQNSKVAATQETKPQLKIRKLTDIEGHWAANFIQELIKLGIVKGFPNRTFRPDATITRSQYAALIVQAFNPNALREAIQFEDIKQNHWAYQVIQQAYQSKLISGYPGKKFLPNQNIPRIQVIVSLVNGLGLTNEVEADLNIYQDSHKIPNYGIHEVAAATQHRLIVNYPKIEKLNPNQSATRAEVAVMVYQTLVLIGKATAIDSPYIVR